MDTLMAEIKKYRSAIPPMTEPASWKSANFFRNYCGCGQTDRYGEVINLSFLIQEAN